MHGSSSADQRVRPASLAEFGAVIGDPIRAAILLHLSDGSRRPAGELAALAGASPQACSAHLARLVASGLLAAEPQGRHRFYAIASGEVAELLEELANWMEPRRRLHHDRALCQARLCYDHMAGRLGVAVFDRMTVLGFLLLSPEGPQLSQSGTAWCHRHGIDITAPPRSRRPLARLCLDWTERRPHIGGRLGASFAARLLETGMIERRAKPRTLLLTRGGSTFLRAELGLEGSERSDQSTDPT